MYYVLHTQGKNAAVYLEKNDGNFQTLKGLRKNDLRFKFQQIKETEDLNGKPVGVINFTDGSNQPIPVVLVTPSATPVA
jgi:hypothetical protein